MSELSPQKLELVREFLEDLEEEDNLDATEELLSVRGFKFAFERANQQIKKGKTKNWRKIRDDLES